MTLVDRANPAGIDLEALQKDLAVNTFGVLTAADQAVKGFRQLPEHQAKTFIFTGNRLNIEPIPGLLNLGIGKSASAYFVADAASAYKLENIRCASFSSSSQSRSEADRCLQVLLRRRAKE